MAIGTQLEFTPDYETWWGPGWELDNGLDYKKVSTIHLRLFHNLLNFKDNKYAPSSQVGDKLMNVTATSLIAPGVTNTHYCDFLTPYRALEWIYTESVRHGGPFQ